MRLALLALMVCLLPVNAFAISYCSEPSKPYCADMYMPFDSSFDFEMCKNEVESYVSSVNDYVSCLQNEASEKQREANSVIDSFNTRASMPR